MEVELKAQSDVGGVGIAVDRARAVEVIVAAGSSSFGGAAGRDEFLDAPKKNSASAVGDLGARRLRPRLFRFRRHLWRRTKTLNSTRRNTTLSMW